MPFTFGMYINIAFASNIQKQNPPIIKLTDNFVNLPQNTVTSTPKATVIQKTPSPVASNAETTVLLPTPTPSITDKTFDDERIVVNVFDRDSNEVVTMNLHDYLINVVAAEMPATFEFEAIKAQAVAARTFTVKHMRASCSSNSNAHVCTYYGCCQAYVSVEKMKKNWKGDFDEKYTKVRQAVEDTDSLILTYNGEPITVFYFSTSNGYTEACQDVFVKNLPYYKSVKSLGEEDAPNYHSYVKIAKKEFALTLYDKFGINVSENDIEQTLNFEYTPGNRVAYVYFNGKAVKGTDFRTAFGLKSADFKFTFFEDYILIDVYGYGHGVGMSQVGANVMAKSGKCFEDILSHFYVDTVLANVK